MIQRSSQLSLQAVILSRANAANSTNVRSSRREIWYADAVKRIAKRVDGNMKERYTAT